ncbi:MAG: beta-lactamase family protein [Chitinophagales bacterium]|nr:beta-lactamase family protein [Chitinophagales bacterium]
MKIISQFVLCAIIIICFSKISFAQDTGDKEKTELLQRYFEGYNNQNYKQMHECMGGLMKTLFTENRIKEAYGIQFEIFGRVKISSIKFTPGGYAKAFLKYEKDTTEEYKMGFAISSKFKIIGLSASSPHFDYALSTDPSQKLSDAVVTFKIDSMMQIKNALGVFNGCMLAIRNGKTIYQNCFGYADYESKRKLNDSSMFELASCSKQFTATAILILQEQGKLSIHDNIQKFIPELPYDNVTIENFLDHTSGITEYEELLEEHWDKTKFVTNSDLATLFKQYHPKLQFAPGKKFEYSNTGYAMLSLIIERVSGMSYANFLSKNIFQPLEMKDTRVYNTRRVTGELIDNYAFGHVYSDSLKAYVIPDQLSDYSYVIYMDAITGDGTVNSNILDLAKWEECLRKNSILNESAMSKAFLDHTDSKREYNNYGYGWELQASDSSKHKVAYHSGSWPGYTTFIVHFLDEETSLIILSNNEYMNIELMAYKIAGWLVRD